MFRKKKKKSISLKDAGISKEQNRFIMSLLKKLMNHKRKIAFFGVFIVFLGVVKFIEIIYNLIY